ncbi:MAG: alpha/beta fold hydrolase [Stellaceae bacterium]
MHLEVATQRSIEWPCGTLSFLETGAPSDPAIVLLHGLGSRAESWRDQLAELPRHRLRVIAWDQPGYGLSTALPMSGPSPADYARAVTALVDALDLPRFFLLGHSLGALIAGVFAGGRGGARVEKLVLASPTPGFAGAEPEILRAKIQQRIDDMTVLGPVRLAEQRARHLLSTGASPEAVERVRTAMASLDPEAYMQAVRMLAQGDLLALAPRIARTTLVTSGTADLVTPEAQCRRIADALPNGRYVPLSGLGHVSYVEDPRAFEAALLPFLQLEKK